MDSANYTNADLLPVIYVTLEISEDWGVRTVLADKYNFLYATKLQNNETKMTYRYSIEISRGPNGPHHRAARLVLRLPCELRPRGSVAYGC